MKEHENLKALVYGHDLNDYQRKLAQNEFESLLHPPQTEEVEDSKTVVLKEARELIQNYVDSGLTNVDIKNMLYRIDLALSEQALNKKG